ncbi:MAG TPA: sigma-54 dependent transcriptional regulator [Candidatus Limnocylindria bacterium]|nr:sigma-54 dependent transcriptional regulator [Candidatus Limnocylindria bacterium]
MDKLLLIDDEADVQYSFKRIFDSPELELHTASSGEEGLRLLSKCKPDLVISDIRMAGMNGLETLRKIRQIDPKVPVIMMTAYGTTQMAIEAMKLGAYDYLLKPFDVPKLKLLVAAALKASRDMKQTVALQPLLEPQDYDQGVIGRSESMQTVFKLVGQVAATDATALITGESGTGKELVARAVYHNSRRAQGPFIAINCAAIPENLLESELFGHEKGAFTGATAQRIGKFEQCNGGTVFLDEIGDMPLATQTKILRVLQNGTLERVGGNETIKVDVRVIAATNKPLEDAVARKEFREDLFYRLNVVRIHLPPLRERKEDIRLLVDFFLRRQAGAGGTPKTLSGAALSLLEAYQWPGNVRELENVLRRAVVVAKGPSLVPNDFPPELTNAKSSVQAAPVVQAASAVTDAPVPVPTGESSGPQDLASIARTLFEWAKANGKLKVLPAVERELVIEALRETSGNQVQAAKLLGITRATLRKRVEKFGIKRELVVH